MGMRPFFIMLLLGPLFLPGIKLVKLVTLGSVKLMLMEIILGILFIMLGLVPLLIMLLPGIRLVPPFYAGAAGSAEKTGAA